MLKNNSKGYGWIAIMLHWLMAVGIFSLFGLGLYMVELSYYDPWYRDSLELHKSLGVVLLLVLFFRLVWRWSNTSPEISGSLAEKKMAHVGHKALYAIMLVLMITGYLISTADGRAISVFGLVDLPAISFSFENQEDTAGEIHWLLAWGLILMAALHALAALKHHFINKDGTLNKMLRPKPE